MIETLDKTDLLILKTLQKNAKLTTKELADAVNLSKQINHEIADAFTRRIQRIPEVTECYNTSGAYDYLLKVRAQDMKQYQEFVLNKLGDIDSVGSIESTFVMSEVKQNYGINI